MIYSLRGTLIYSDISSAVVECGGVGYRCTVTAKTAAMLPQLGEEAALYTYMAVREDSIDLYGFIDIEELEFFRKIISVNGIGPKIGINVLSDFTPEQLAACIISGDTKTLSKANGLGIKTAQRLVLELKDKFKGITVASNDAPSGVVTAAASAGVAGEAIEALISIGFTQPEAVRAVSSLDQSLSVEEMIKEALKAASKL